MANSNNGLSGNLPGTLIFGVPGKDGATFTPSVDDSGNLSWSNDGGLENPETKNIRGPQGATGQQGPEGPEGPQGEQGEPGEDGGFYTPGAELYSTGVMKITWNASKTSMAGLPPKYIQLPEGKSAYEYAVEGGYEGTEEEFAELMNRSGEAVRYTAQELTDEQQAQARENIGAATIDDVVNTLEGGGGVNLIAGVGWDAGYFYRTGGETTENYDYYGYLFRMQSSLAVTPGMNLKCKLIVPASRDIGTGLTAGSTVAQISHVEYDSEGAFIQRVQSGALSGDVSEGYEYIEYEYTVPEDVYSVRMYITTFKENPEDIFAVYDADHPSCGMRILPEATSANNGKVPVVSGEQYVLVELPSTTDSATETPIIVGTSVGDTAMEFSYLMHGMDAVESFIFFADPHFLNSIDNEAQMREYLDTLKQYHDVTPTSFVIGGGDWYGNSDTYETACFKLGYIDGWMRRLFGDNYYQAVGNHDTNQQGKDETGGTWTGILPKETVRNLWFRKRGDTYYAFDGNNTRFYVLDTWKEGTDAAYYWEQIAWLGETLKTDNADNVALVLHMGYGSSGDSYAVNTLAANALALCEAFNNATSITLNGVTYDFTGCTGKVRFALSGHIHVDYASIVNGIPLIATTHMRDGDTPTFDLCLADYGTNTLNLVRVGAGENRLYTMGPDGAIIDATEDDTLEEEPSLPVTLAVADPVVFVPSQHNGSGINYDNHWRAIVATTENTGAPYGVASGSTDVTHYALVIPDGATTITVNCGEELNWVIDVVNANGGKIGGSAAWLESGASEAIPAESVGYYMVKFIKVNDTKFTEEDDVSGISWTFS